MQGLAPRLWQRWECQPQRVWVQQWGLLGLQGWQWELWRNVRAQQRDA